MEGSAITSANTITIMAKNGNVPLKMSSIETLSSSMVDLIAKSDMPKGGVNNPISMLITVTIPSQIKFKSYVAASGSVIGTTKIITDALSRIVPNKIKNAT
jgi:hypothetical protein